MCICCNVYDAHQCCLSVSKCVCLCWYVCTCMQDSLSVCKPVCLSVCKSVSGCASLSFGGRICSQMYVCLYVFRLGKRVFVWVFHTCLLVFALSACHAILTACCNLTTEKLTNNRQEGPIEDTAEAYSHHANFTIMLQAPVMSLCCGPAALFTMEAVVKAIAKFLTNLPQDSGALPAEGLTWVISCILTTLSCTSMC